MQKWEENAGKLKIFANKYIGEFKEGKRNGVGLFYYSNGEIYVGEWLNDLKHGFGLQLN